MISIVVVAVAGVPSPVTHPVNVLGHPGVHPRVFFVAAVITERHDALDNVLPRCQG